MLIALAFAHFSSELLLKEQMIIPVKKTKLNNAGHIDAKKNPAKSAVFYWLFLGEVSPRNFPWNRPIFLIICPRKSFKIWLFSAKIPRNRPIVLRILTFLPRKSREIGRVFREFAPENPAKFCFFSAKYQKPCIVCIRNKFSQGCIIMCSSEIKLKGAQCSQPARSRVPSMGAQHMICMEELRISSCTREQKSGARGHEALLEHSLVYTQARNYSEHLWLFKT